jgi:hypothetical protein
MHRCDGEYRITIAKCGGAMRYDQAIHDCDQLNMMRHGAAIKLDRLERANALIWSRLVGTFFMSKAHAHALECIA